VTKGTKKIRKIKVRMKSKMKVIKRKKSSLKTLLKIKVISPKIKNHNKQKDNFLRSKLKTC